MSDFIIRSNSSGLRSITCRSYSTGNSLGGVDNNNNTGCWHDSNNSIDVCFFGGNAVDSNFVFKELGAVLSSEHRYYCHVHITSRINKIPLCKELERICIRIGYKLEDIEMVVKDFIIPQLKFYDSKPERVDVVFSLFAWSQAEIK